MTTVLKFNQNGKTGFNSLFDNLLKDFPATANENRYNPQVNISETKDAFILDFNAPGRAKEFFNVKLDRNLLTVSSDAKDASNDENVKQIRKEFAVNAFSRTFTIDEKIAVENIAAKYENGILSVTLPKKEEVKVSPKQISIQ